MGGWILDRLFAPSCHLTLSPFQLVVYNEFGGISYGFCIGQFCRSIHRQFAFDPSGYLSIGLSFLTGFLVNGPYCLITTAVSADLVSTCHN